MCRRLAYKRIDRGHCVTRLKELFQGLHVSSLFEFGRLDRLTDTTNDSDLRNELPKDRLLGLLEIFSDSFECLNALVDEVS